jgi:hypothetical protein
MKAREEQTFRKVTPFSCQSYATMPQLLKAGHINEIRVIAV